MSCAAFDVPRVVSEGLARPPAGAKPNCGQPPALGAGVGLGVGVGLKTWNVAEAERPLFWPLPVTLWPPGVALLGTTKVVENVPPVVVVAKVTDVASKVTATVSRFP